MTHQFQSEAIRGGNIIRPQVITIDDNSITISQRSKFLISNNTQHIKINNITNIQIDKTLCVFLLKAAAEQSEPLLLMGCSLQTKQQEDRSISFIIYLWLKNRP